MINKEGVKIGSGSTQITAEQFQSPPTPVMPLATSTDLSNYQSPVTSHRMQVPRRVLRAICIISPLSAK
ncbi:hypothetical protein E2C01_028303 [Portunus trituberculatus]|uniref:Uncharacterized protein n=1 Tax=Portunus trituberculatus TaxID=210409 RepID=A0A5B7EK40_PORTR|nr:hypothetical protein [Portunus trituberculatus]